LSIAPGEVVGIVGPSGSGKSTMTKLIQRLYQPERGQILIDGIDIAQVDPTWLRRHIGVVLQENVLFNRTIHENIAFANPATPRANVIRVAQLAGAHEFIAQLPQGYDTMIEERGANLSGGQRQRIAIARALATNPRILIFDEATSALDYESERSVQQNMREIVRGRTVLIIAHRLAAVRSCDHIISLLQGRIVEQGTHDELVKCEKGVYGHLWTLQGGQMGGAAS
jgi:ATP-binding cassette, subfamily B, bacterial HlyB/CyaB